MLKDEQKKFIVTKIETIEEDIASQKLAQRAFKVGYFGISAMLCSLMVDHVVLQTYLDYLALIIGKLSFSALSTFNIIMLISEVAEKIGLENQKEVLKSLLEESNVEHNDLGLGK